LPPKLPRAVASSSSTRWIRAHLEHLGLTEDFGEHIYSGREHVERGKPAPDLYLYAAKQIGVPIGQSVIVEDSRVGVTGALASGARVIGLAAGSHCLDGHGEMLRQAGVSEVAYSFEDLRRLLSLS
jgi:beta-phosphoglucomutase-like phosphatase (HAD superfamily)